MNWSRVKTVLIILFLCTDIFLLSVYFTSKYTPPVISQEIIGSTVDVLANNNISINPSIIPRKMPGIPHAEAENVISDYETFAKSILDGEISQIEYGFENHKGKITFYGDRFNFISSLGINPLAETLNITDEKKAEESAVSELKQLGFNLDSAKIYVSKTNDTYTVVLKNYVNALPMFNSQIIVTLSRTSVLSISGTWFNQIKTSGSDNTLKNITAALIDFIPKATGPTEITDINYGYSLFDTTLFHKSATLIPSWELTAKDGTTYILDARNL